jgi:carboxypeptidase C (cathepsin A)
MSSSTIVFAILLCVLAVVYAAPKADNYVLQADYVTVDEANGANVLYWLYQRKDSLPNDNKPVVFFLQGGPGASSMLGVCV